MQAALWMLWLVVAILALAGELLTLGLFFASLSIAGLAAAAGSAFLPVPLQIVLFCVASLVMLVAVRPVALRFLPRGSTLGQSSALGPVGRNALATELITNLQGQIRIGSGEFWSARGEAPDVPIDPGGEVEVVRMDGLTAVVRPVRRQNYSGREAAPRADRYGLTAREVEVLQLLALGLSNAAIATRLVVSQRTVDHHVGHILDKMNASGRLEAVRHGVDEGIVHLHRDSST